MWFPSNQLYYNVIMLNQMKRIGSVQYFRTYSFLACRLAKGKKMNSNSKGTTVYFIYIHKNLSYHFRILVRCLFTNFTFTVDSIAAAAIFGLSGTRVLNVNVRRIFIYNLVGFTTFWKKKKKRYTWIIWHFFGMMMKWTVFACVCVSLCTKLFTLKTRSN